MLAQDLDLIKRLRELKALAKERAKEIVQKEEMPDAQRLSDQAKKNRATTVNHPSTEKRR